MRGFQPNLQSRSFFGNPFFADSFFHGMSAESARKLQAITKTNIFGSHELLFDVGESPASVYILTKGRARLFFNDPGKEARTGSKSAGKRDSRSLRITRRLSL
jgi:CRP-like cAMP-binding protein